MHTSKRKKILMISARYKPAVGGVEKHIEQIVNLFGNSKFVIDIITGSHMIGLNDEKDRCGDILRLPFKWDRNPFLIFRWAWSKRKLISSYDIVHVHDAVPFLMWALPLLLFRPMKPIFMTFHGYEADPIPLRFVILRKIVSFLAKRSICIGNFIEQLYGIECDEISIGAVNSFDVSAQKNTRAVYVGRIEEDTGIVEYIEAISILKRKYGYNMELVVCGQGTLVDDIQSFAIKKQVELSYLGIINDIISELDTSYVCFAAGYLSILESFSVGTPVIGIAKSNLRYEYLKSVKLMGGPISIQRDSESIAEYIFNLRKNTELYDKLVDDGRKFASQNSWYNLKSVYERLWMMNSDNVSR